MGRSARGTSFLPQAKIYEVRFSASPASFVPGFSSCTNFTACLKDVSNVEAMFCLFRALLLLSFSERFEATDRFVLLLCSHPWDWHTRHGNHNVMPHPR